MFVQNKKPSLSTRTPQYIYHFGFPIISLLCFAATVLWFTNGEISRVSYWTIQLEWFDQISQTLSQWRVFFKNVTQLGDALILLPIISFLIVWHPQVWAGFFGAIPLGTLLSTGGKYLLAVPRPGVVLDQAIYTAVGGNKGFHSLPSGHTITIFAMIAVVILVLIPQPKNRSQYCLLFCAFLIAAFIAISRVAVGVHWPLDIVAGAALGYLAGISGVALTQRYQGWWHWMKEEKHQLILGVIMAAWSLGLFKRVLKDSDNTDIIIWIAALMGLCTALYLLTKSAFYHLKATPILDTKNENLASMTIPIGEKNK